MTSKRGIQNQIRITIDPHGGSQQAGRSGTVRERIAAIALVREKELKEDVKGAGQGRLMTETEMAEGTETDEAQGTGKEARVGTNTMVEEVRLSRNYE